MAYMLNILAAAQSHEGGRNNRDIILEMLSREQIQDNEDNVEFMPISVKNSHL